MESENIFEKIEKRNCFCCCSKDCNKCNGTEKKKYFKLSSEALLEAIEHLSNQFNILLPYIRKV